MNNNINDKAARAKKNLQKKAQDLAKNRDKYIGKDTPKSNQEGPAKNSHNNQKDNRNRSQKTNGNKVNLPTTTRRGTVVRAQRMVSSDINMRASSTLSTSPSISLYIMALKVNS